MSQHDPWPLVLTAVLGIAGCSSDSPAQASGDTAEDSTTEAPTSSGRPTGSGTSTGTGSSTGTTGSTTSDPSTSTTTATGTGTGTGTDTEGSPALPAGAIVLFDADCPAGFVEATEFAGRYLRGHDGDSQFDETGGAATHSHALASHTHATGLAGGGHTHGLSFGSASASVGIEAGSVSMAAASDQHSGSASASGGTDHVHTVNASAALNLDGTNEPAWREAVFCRVEPDLAEIPTGAIVLADQACGAGTTEAAGFADRLLRGHDGDATLAEVGGADTHAHPMPHDHGGATLAAGSHTHGGTTAAAGLTFLLTTGPSAVVTTGAHTHQVSLSGTQHAHTVPAETAMTSSSAQIPAYREAAMCTLDAAIAQPAPGTLILFDAPCPVGFIEEPGFQNRFIRGHDGDADFMETGGADNHGHDGSHSHDGVTGAQSHDHRGSMSPTTATVSGLTGPNSTAAGGHTHFMSVAGGGSHTHGIVAEAPAVTSDAHVPEFAEIVVCRVD